MAGKGRSPVSLLLAILASLLVPSCNSGAVQLDNNNIDGMSFNSTHLILLILILILILILFQGFLRTTTWC